MTYDGDEAGRRARHLIPVLYLDAVALVVGTFLLLRPPSGFDRGPFRSGPSSMFPSLFLVGVVLTVATALLWLRWFQVVTERAEATGRTRFRDWWWFWAWVIPGVNLVLPKMIVNDVWHAADVRRPDPMPPVIGGWWAVWVVTGAFRYLQVRYDLPAAPGVAAAFLLAEAVQAVLAAGMVRRLTERDRLLGSDPAWLAPVPEEQPVS